MAERAVAYLPNRNHYFLPLTPAGYVNAYCISITKSTSRWAGKIASPTQQAIRFSPFLLRFIQLCCCMRLTTTDHV